MIEIVNNEISFLKDNKCLLLFYFTANWCGPCKKIKPLIEKISKGLDATKVEVYQVDIDKNEELSEKLSIKSVPAFYLFHEGKLIDDCRGSDISNVHKLIKNNMNKVESNL